MRNWYVYILTNKRYGTLYIGVTRAIVNRLLRHRQSGPKHFVGKYVLNQLVYLEEFENPLEAIKREKQLKKWNRKWKIDLIEKQNREWEDMSRYLISVKTGNGGSPHSRG